MMREQAEKALQLASVEPDDARVLAAVVEVAAAAVGDWTTVSIAARAAGVAAVQTGDIGSAVAEHRKSVRAARRSGLADLLGEARMSLASALVIIGRTEPALREIDGALQTLRGLAHARALVQRAAILQEIGRDDDALRDIRAALPLLHRHHDVQWETRALSNRGLMHLSRREFAAAEADLQAARSLCSDHDLGIAAAYVEQNLGCLKARRGEVPAALHHFDVAEAHYRRLGLVEGSLLVDRAEVLLAVRLVAEARAAAEAAVATHQEHERGNHVPEAQLLLAAVALEQHDAGAALSASADALDRFRRLHRASWASLARFAHLRAMLSIYPDRATAAQARRAADALARSGWAVQSLEARVLASRLALQQGDTKQARRDLAVASRARSYGPAEVRAHAWYAEALLRREDGRRRAAVAAICAGLHVVELHRATLGATELRAHVSVHLSQLAQLGLRMAVEDRSARRTLAWAERGRASAALMRPVSPPRDEILAQYLADLRTTVSELGEARTEGAPATALESRQIQLERAISEYCRQYPGAAGGSLVRSRTARELVPDIGAAALVEYVEIDDTLMAVTLVDGRADLHVLGPTEPVTRSMQQASFALHRLADARRPAGSVAAATAALNRAAADLDRLLLAPLALIVDRALIIVPTSTLRSLPWSVLPSCQGRPVTVSPSATLWNEALHRGRESPRTGVVVVAGPGLPGARVEAEAIARLHRGATLLVDGHAVASEVAVAIDGAYLAHIAAHGQLRSDNPLFSALLLNDGPYTVYDLERVPMAPRHVVLAACDTGRSFSVAGDEILGLTAALLSQGTSTLVAPVVAVPDIETVSLMRDYHTHFAKGRSPAEALSLAQQTAAATDRFSRAAAAGFLCLGDGLSPQPLAHRSVEQAAALGDADAEPHLVSMGSEEQIPR